MVVLLYGRMHGKWGNSGSTRIIQTCRNMSCVLCIICNTADWFSSEFPIRCCTCGSEKPRLLCSTTTKRSSRSAGTRSHQGCGATAATWALQLYSLWLSGDNLCELWRQQSLSSCHSVEQLSVYLPVKIIKKKKTLPLTSPGPGYHLLFSGFRLCVWIHSHPNLKRPLQKLNRKQASFRQIKGCFVQLGIMAAFNLKPWTSLLRLTVHCYPTNVCKCDHKIRPCE